jgi:hypothetical protein
MSSQQTRLAALPNQDASELVIRHYLTTTSLMMQSYLTAQQNVMLSYLQGAQTSSTQVMGHFGAWNASSLAPAQLSTSPSKSAAPVKPIVVANELPITVLAASCPTETPVESLPVQTEPDTRTETSLPAPANDAPNLDCPESSVQTSTERLELSDEELMAALTELISEKTGYPVEMLEPDLDLESDLGIDSIKRIEILSKFQTFMPESKRAILQDSIEELASARTLNQVFEWIKNPPQPASKPGSDALTD